ncbi:polysaccharide biosynthesis C-terminal domain-containing protein [Halorubrum ezzemoulense]|uniref:oligosaccharide flippase family protein n=1 Tax=Halorubrum ezzemoulense TaxID=337243 RepID=UPI00232C5829|nr:polysaccharide biosynthesis C-terminal domain-containing protein [Halorubrum ezzemoulense]MDB2252225.1 polysaccharide biosynthesis C-terminal domain-containing protein [Halorubrum ezzemoulense]
MLRKYIKSAGSIFFGNLSLLTIRVISLPILARLLTVGQYGDFGYLSSIEMLLGLAIAAGIPNGVRRFIGEGRSAERVLATYLYLYTFTIILVSSIFVSVILLFQDQSPLSLTVMGFLLSVAILRQTFDILRSFILVEGEEPVAEALRTFSEMAYYGCGLLFVWAGFGIIGLVFGFIIGTVASLIVTSTYIGRTTKLSNILSAEKLDLFPLIRYSGLFSITALFATSLLFVDVIILRLVRGDEQAGYYQAALQISQFIVIAPKAIQTMSAYQLADLWGDKGQLSRITTSLVKYSLILVLLLAIGIGVLSKPFIGLYFGPKYEVASTPLRILLPGVVFYSLFYVIYGIELSHERPVLTLGATCIASITNIILNLLLIPMYGLSGAALASSIGYTLLFIFNYISLKYMGVDIHVSDIPLLRIGVNSTLTLGLLVLLLRTIPSNYGVLVVIPPVGLIVYTTLNIISGVIDADRLRRLISRNQ